MSFTRLSFLLCWVCSLLGAVVIAQYFPSTGIDAGVASEATVSEPPLDSDKLQDAHATNPANALGKCIRTDTDTITIPAGMNPERRTALAMYLRTQDSPVRKYWRDKLFDGLAVSDYPLMVQAIRELVINDNEANSEMDSLFYKWGQAEPQSALRFLEQEIAAGKRRNLPSSFIDAWYETAPDEALAWAWLAPSNLYDNAFDVVIKEAENNPRNLLESMIRNPHTYHEQVMGITVALRAWKDDPGLAFTYVDNLTNGNISLRDIDQIGSLYAQKSVEEGYAWAETFTQPAKKRFALSSVIRQHAKMDAYGAYDRLQAMGDDSLIDEMFSYVGDEMIKASSYEEAKEWVEGLAPNRKNDGFYATMASKLLFPIGDLKHQEPTEQTMDLINGWLAKISNEDERRRAERQIELEIRLIKEVQSRQE